MDPPIPFVEHWQISRLGIQCSRLFLGITDDPNTRDWFGSTPIIEAAIKGHIDVLKFLAPLTKTPNRKTKWRETPIERAQRRGHHEFARILQSYINTGHF